MGEETISHEEDSHIIFVAMCCQGAKHNSGWAVYNDFLPRVQYTKGTGMGRVTTQSRNLANTALTGGPGQHQQSEVILIAYILDMMR